jgi:YidC/Oxa1 family membrane protein insertase
MAQEIKLPGSPNENPGMEKNLLLAFILMGVVIFGSQYFMPKQPAPSPQKKQEAPKAAAPATPAPAAATAAATPAAGAPQAVVAAKEEVYRIETDLYRVEFSNKGGVVTSWVLKNFKDSLGKPLQLVHNNGTSRVGYPFSVQVNGKEMNPNLNWYLFAAKPSADGLGIEFNYQQGNNRARKSFRFRKDQYLVDVESDLTLNGAPVQHNLAWRGGFGDHAAYNAYSLGTTVRYDVSRGKLETKTAAEAAKTWSTDNGNFFFAGIQDQFFAAVAVNKSGIPLELQTTSDTFVPVSDKDNKEQPNIGMAVGGAAANKLSFFVGPKDLDILKAVDPRLEQMVDFGTWFGIVAKPLFYALTWLNTNFIHNYGWSIIVLTIIINLLTLPLKLSSMKSMQKTALIQPELQRINDKYKGISMTDPRAAKKNEEVMELYKKHDINPAGGCLPLMLQMPFLIGFYSVLSVAIEMRQASWLWVGDLSQPETLAIRILPVLMVATQFLLQKMTPSTGMDPQQQRIMLFMPLMFAFMFYGASSGLVLYWLTGNVFAMLQQFVYSKVKPAPVTPPSQTVVNVKKKK